jgi:hypothetical protein
MHLSTALYYGKLTLIQDLNPKLIIYDPLNPVNNVGRTTYRIAALKVEYILR